MASHWVQVDLKETNNKLKRWVSPHRDRRIHKWSRRTNYTFKRPFVKSWRSNNDSDTQSDNIVRKNPVIQLASVLCYLRKKRIKMAYILLMKIINRKIMICKNIGSESPSEESSTPLSSPMAKHTRSQHRKWSSITREEREKRDIFRFSADIWMYLYKTENKIALKHALTIYIKLTSTRYGKWMYKLLKLGILSPNILVVPEVINAGFINSIKRKQLRTLNWGTSKVKFIGYILYRYSWFFDIKALISSGVISSRDYITILCYGPPIARSINMHKVAISSGYLPLNKNTITHYITKDLKALSKGPRGKLVRYSKVVRLPKIIIDNYMNLLLPGALVWQHVSKQQLLSYLNTRGERDLYLYYMCKRKRCILPEYHIWKSSIIE